MTDADLLSLLSFAQEIDRIATELRKDALEAENFLVVATCDLALDGYVSDQCHYSLRAGDVRILSELLTARDPQGAARKAIHRAHEAASL